MKNKGLLFGVIGYICFTAIGVIREGKLPCYPEAPIKAVIFQIVSFFIWILGGLLLAYLKDNNLVFYGKKSE